MTYLVYLYARASYALHRALHASCDKREIQAFHRGYVKGAQDERSVIRNATLERQVRDAIRDAGW